jgi:ATP-dependent DNA helicase RecQ
VPDVVGRDERAGDGSPHPARPAREAGASGGTAQPFALPPGADAALFELLRQLRRQEASRAGVQPYQVFTDAVLAEMARGRPTTEEGLKRISGVGEYRAQQFGRIFLKAIATHCLRAGLEQDVPPPRVAPGSRPAAPPAAPPAKPSAKKEQAFKLFAKGASVADVARATELTPSTINEYLAEFVRTQRPASIFAWVPEDVCERVAAAADIHGTGKLKPVFLELNGEVSYEHIRVVLALLDARAA